MASKTSSSPHNILVLGASFAGIGIAHYLLRHVLPALSSPSSTYKVTLVSPSSHFFWKIGAPRFIVNPAPSSLDKAFVPIAEGFKAYDKARFEFVQAEASSLDLATNTLVAKATGGVEKGITLNYDTLIIATGTTSASPLWTLQGSYEHTRDAIADVQARIPKAQSILVAGGGPAGTETAGELGTEHGHKKEITLLSGTDRLLAKTLRRAIGADAESKLKNLGVKTIHEVRVESATEVSNGKTHLKLSNGTEMTVDVYIDATGGSPNTSFLPHDWLNEKGFVLTDGPTLTVTAPGVQHVFAIGSVASYSLGGVLDAKYAVKPLAESVRLDLQARVAKTDKSEQYQEPGNVGWISWLTSWFWSTPADSSKRKATYKQITSEMQFVPIGRKSGVGAIFGWKAPAWFVVMLKSKTFMIEQAPKLVDGSDYVKT